MRGDTCVGAAKTEGYVNFACYKRRRLRGDTCVGAAKTERDVNFACYKPRAIAGGGEGTVQGFRKQRQRRASLAKPFVLSFGHPI